MIGTLFFNMGAWLIGVIAWAIPNWLIPDAIENSISTIVTEALKFEPIFPMSVIVICISAILMFNIILYSVRVITWTISLFRGGGGTV